MDSGRAQLKKEALQYIVATYLTRKNNEDIQFIHQNIISTNELAINVGSSLTKGLDRPALIINQNLFGTNNKRASMGLPLTQVLCRELTNYQFILIIVISIISLITGIVFSHGQLTRDGIWLIVYSLVLEVVRVALWYKTEHDLQQFSQNRDKNDVYRVIRNGQSVQVAEEKLVTGDIIQIGYKEKIPASGILVSNKEIMVNQEIIGRKIQRKMNLEQCLQYIETMSNLQLKLAFENAQLPSPVLIKGTQVTLGSGRMIVLVLNDEQFIKKYRPDNVSTLGCKKLDEWSERLIKKWSKLCYSATFIFLFTAIGVLVIRKWLARQEVVFDKIFPQIIKILMCVISFFALCSSQTAMIFIRVSIIRFLISVRQPQETKKILTASQIIITEQNILRYDQISIAKIASLQKRDIIDKEQVNSLSEVQLDMINQVLTGVNLRSPFSKEPENKELRLNKNDVIQRYTTYQRIVTSFGQSEQIPKYADNRTLFQLNNKQANPVVEVSKNQQQLISVIRTNCKYTTQRILSGLMQIAQKKCKTYYYKKYSSEELKNISYAHVNAKVVEITKQLKQKIKMMSRKIVIENLVPVMLGYSQGFDNNCEIGVFVCLIGISKYCRNSGLQVLRRLQDIGIKTLILIPSQPESKPINVQELVIQYQGKDWLQFRQQQTCDMATLRKASGRLVCGCCLIANCDCKNRVQQVSNILKFMKMVSEVRIIYGVTSQTDIYYLECAFSQIKQTCLSVTNHHSDTIELLSDLLKGFNLLQAIQRGLTFFCASTITLASVIGFLGISQDVAFFSRQMMSFLIFAHVLPLITHVFDTSSHGSRVISTNRRVLPIFTRFSSILIFTFSIFTFLIALFLFLYPNFIPQSFNEYDRMILNQIDHLKCQFAETDTVMKAFIAQHCRLYSDSGKFQKVLLIYSRHSTILFTYLFHAILIFFVIHSKNFKRISNLVSFAISIGLYLGGISIGFSCFQGYFNSITVVQYLIAVGFSVLSVAASFLVTNIINQFTEFVDPQLSSQLNFDENGQKHYSNILKKYLSYSDQFILMRKQDD